LTLRGVWPLALLVFVTGQSSPAASVNREKAIAAIQRRAQAASPGSAEAFRASAELAEIGRQFLDEGQTAQAIELLSEAYGLDEENGLVLSELTLAHVRAADYDSARFYLQLAEEHIESAPPEIYGVLGDIYYSMNRLEDSVLAWSEFVRFGGQDPGRLRSLQRARDEMAVTSGQRSFVGEHFSIFADPDVSDAMIHLASEDLEAAYRRETDFFGAAFREPQVAVLYAGRSYFSLVSIPDWVSGVFDGKIRVCVETREGAERALSAVLVHELAHALIRLRSRDRAPGWLHEGLSQWWEGRRLPRPELKEVFGQRGPASLDALEASFRSKLDRRAARASYAGALSLVEYLMAIRGEGVFSCLLEDLGSGADFATALRAQAGLAPAELFRQWKAWAGV
jgi:tetratricopeptide (TPR) repeat protein